MTAEERKMWIEAEIRADRAKRYAKKFPQMIGNKDLVFQELEWQYKKLLTFPKPEPILR